MIGELFQPSHLLFLVSMLILLFGGRKISSLGRGFRDGIVNFRSSLKAPQKKRD